MRYSRLRCHHRQALFRLAERLRLGVAA